MVAKRFALVPLALGAVAWAPVSAGTAAREGTEAVVEFVATVNLSSRSDISVSTVKRILKGSCRVQAGNVAEFGLAGPTKEQEKAKPDPTLADLEKQAKACKGDQECLRKLAEKAAEAGAGETPPQSDGAFQVWYPQSCRGSFEADETHITNDPGGEGGGGAFQATRTIKGRAEIPEGGEDGWLGVYIEANLAKNTTSYQFTHPEPVLLDSKTVRTGYQAGTRESKVGVSLLSTMFPNPWGPFKGPPSSGAATKTIDNGTLTVEWQINR